MNTKHLVAKFFTPGLKKFSNIHRGESCYIFGDGPSIKWFDLNCFTDLPGICCGLIPFHNDFNKLNVKYITSIAPWIFVNKNFQPKREYLNQIPFIIEEYRNFIINTPNKEFFISLSNFPFMRGSNINYVFRGLPEIRNETDRLLWQFNLFDGSFNATLALAYYFGFSKIYLVGFDAWTVQPSRTKRWYELGAGEIYESTNFAIEFLSVLSRSIEIFSISNIGTSKNVTLIDYFEYTGQQPVYKENYNLMSKERLDILATCPDYNIY